MGLTKPSNLKYLSVSLGRIRKSVPAGTPDAIERKNKSGETVYELVWQTVTGVLRDVTFRQHDEYGNSWILTIEDGAEQFALQLQEDSRYGGDFLKKLPNLRAGTTYAFTPYDYEKNRKKKVGLAIETLDGEKIQSYYQKFTQEGDSWKVENLHGFPDFSGNPKDKDDQKIYFTQVAKFLRGKSQAIAQTFKGSKPQEPATELGEKLDDLPF